MADEIIEQPEQTSGNEERPQNPFRVEPPPQRPAIASFPQVPTPPPTSPAAQEEPKQEPARPETPRQEESGMQPEPSGDEQFPLREAAPQSGGPQEVQQQVQQSEQQAEQQSEGQPGQQSEPPQAQQSEQQPGREAGERNQQDPRRMRQGRDDRGPRNRGDRRDRFDRGGNQDRFEGQERPEGLDRDERSDRPERPERTERPERSERQDRPERPERSDRLERPPRTERAERSERPERQDRPVRSERSDRPDRRERQERGDRPERGERGDRPERGERGDRPERGERGDRPERGERRDRVDRFDRLEDSHGHRGGKELSIVIPVYNEEGSLRELYDNIRNGLGRMQRYELIFVDDGSTDGSARIINEFRNRDRSRVKLIRFRRNFGKSAALSVGFTEAAGEIVVTMDSDLQDDPAEIPSLVNEIRKGYDLVSGWKKKRRDPITKTIPSKFFNFVTRMMTGVRLHDMNCGLKAYRREVVKEIRVYGELHRYIPVLASWLGFKIGEIPVVHHRRKFGRTKYGVGRFWKGFLDLLTVMFTTRYLRRPLHLFGFWGILFFLTGLGIDGWLVYERFAYHLWLSDRPLFLGGILLIIVGVQFISIGLIGEMISKTRTGDTDTYSIREMLK